MSALAYNATIAARTDLTEALAIFRVRPDKPPARRPWFAPGQYCVLGLNDDEMPTPAAVQRPMSMASAPEADGPIEFYIRRVTNPRSPHPFTELLWKRHEGDRLYLRPRAAGVFTIEDTIGAGDRRLRVMVAAGTGIAPFMSMIRSEVCRNPAVDLSRWVLLHGVSYPRDLGYRQELLDRCSRNHLKYWGTISRNCWPEWSGDVGRVESFFDRDRLRDLEARLALPPPGLTAGNAVVFVCGMTGTIVGTMIRVIDRGFVPVDATVRRALGIAAETASSMYFEHYDPDEPLIDVADGQTIETLRALVAGA